MQSRAIGGVIAVGLIVVAVVLFVVLRDDNGDEGSAATTTTTAAQAEEKQKPKKKKPEVPKPVTIVVKGGQPVGGVQELTYTKGDRVEFQVQADAEDEVHLHGYDIEEEVAPGKDAEFDFVADIDGGFEVELHHALNQIAELTVEPG